jgi:hypothetical protein
MVMSWVVLTPHPYWLCYFALAFVFAATIFHTLSGVHFLAMSTEHEYGPGSLQHAFLEADLKAAAADPVPSHLC